jgi:hypothetical protein
MTEALNELPLKNRREKLGGAFAEEFEDRG